MYGEEVGNVKMTEKENCILEVQNLSKVFDADTEREKEVLKDVVNWHSQDIKSPKRA